MTIKLAQIVNSEKALQKLLTVKLPVKVAYKISRLVDKVQPELKTFVEQRDKLVTELGTKNEEDGSFSITTKSENWPKFVEEVKKLEEIDVNVDFGGNEFQRVKVEELGEVEIEANDLLTLNWLIE